MSTSPSTPQRPSAALVGALPELERLLEQMSTALTRAMNDSYEARGRHGHGDGYTEAMWQLLKACRFTAQAARAGHTADTAAMHEALRAVDDSAATAAGHARDVRAAAARPAELAALEAPVAETRLDLGDAHLQQMTAHVAAYDQDDDKLTEDDLTVTLLDQRGHPVVRWAGRRGPLALDGRALLDLIAAGETIAAAYDRYLRDTAIQDALQIDQDDSR